MADCAEVPFDPEFALRYLKWRQEKKAARGRRGRVPAPPSIEAVTEKIVQRVEQEASGAERVAAVYRGAEGDS